MQTFNQAHQAHYTLPINKLIRSDYAELVKKALEEDHYENDVTSKAIFSGSIRSNAKMISRGSGMLAGICISEYVFTSVDKNIHLEVIKKDGDMIKPNEIIMKVSGPTRSIFAAERTSLNFLSMLSGIATHSYQLSTRLNSWGIKLLDTRKTIPGFRRLSKYAVYLGGGMNHRIHLADMGLIKDNHIAVAGNIQEAIYIFRKKYPNLKCEVEVTNLKQLKEALKGAPEYILLDNMNPSMIKKAVSMIKKHNAENGSNILAEASGGYTLSNIQVLQNTGVDHVSIGSLGMQIKSLDLSLVVK